MRFLLKTNFKMHCLMGILVFMIAEPILAQELFSISETGAVRLNGTSYKSMKDFIGSREFRESGRRCGHTMAASKRKINTNRSLSGGSRADCTNFFTAIKETYEPKVNISIPIWFHVISRSDGAGTISDQRIKDQIKVLNEDFLAQSGTIGADSVKTRIKFKLAGITRTVNNSWYTDSDADEIAYKQALGKNPNKFLNIYTNDARGFLGYAYLPSSAGAVFDGVVMLSQSIGGRNNGFGNYDQGRTLAHEVGHYLGLLHTFEGGTRCSNNFSSGDLIADTNAESEPFFGSSTSCPARSTCGTPDPVDNFMGYNTDRCMARFTSQQANRMLCSLINYRPGLFQLEINGALIPVIDLLMENQSS